MVRRCIVIGCRSSSGLHMFPVDFEIRRQWLRATGIETLLPRAGVCNKHFTRDSFANLTEFELGYCKQLRLKSDAVPTLALSGPRPQIALPHQGTNLRRLEPKGTRDIGCQTVPVISKFACVQANLKPYTRSKAIQVSRDAGTWMEPYFPESRGESLTPVKRKRCEMSANDSNSHLDGRESIVNCTNLVSCANSSGRNLPGFPLGCSSKIAHDYCNKQVNISTREHQPESIEVKIEPEAGLDHPEDHVRFSKAPEQFQDSIAHFVERTSTLCPSCGCTFQIQNVSDCVSAQLCLQCENRNKFIKQTNIATEHQAGSIEVKIESEVEPEHEPTEDHVSDSEAPAQNKSDISDEEETADIGDVSSDEDWIPNSQTLETEEVKTTDSEEDTEEEEDSEEEISSHGHRNRQLCAECGAFYFLKAHTCVHKTKPYVCNVCGKRCVTERSLKAHSNIHNESYEHPCKYCLVTFKTKLDKLAHEEIHQNTENPYKCPDCPETFASNKKRKIHLKTHRGPKEHKCDICGIRFWTKFSLLRHKVIHTGMKPFECSMCQQTFNQAGHLKSHMRLHTGEKPYKCTHCEESFNHNVSLKSHIERYHTFDLGDKMDKKDQGSIHNPDKYSGIGTDCVNNIVKEQDAEHIQKERVVKGKTKKFPPTGRPVGRPKRK